MSKIFLKERRLKTQICQKRHDTINSSKINKQQYHYSQPKNTSIILKSRVLTQTNQSKISKNISVKYHQPHYLTIMRKPSNDTNRTKTEYCKEQKRYELGSVIGNGAFGIVYKGFELKSNKKVALKKVLQDGHSKNRELSILKELNHVNIIELLDYYTQIQKYKPYLYLVTDYFPCDLHQLLQKQKIKEDILPHYIYQLINGLLYLNQKQIAHRDLKPQNILINKQTHQLVISDFGSAKKLNSNQKNISYVCATPYRAPQLMLGSHYYSTSVDMWSLGCIIYEMVNRRPLFRSQSNSTLLIDMIKLFGTPSDSQIWEMNANFSMNEYKKMPRIRKCSLKNIMMTNNQLLIDLLQKIFVYSPANRLTPSQALEHQYFHSYTKNNTTNTTPNNQKYPNTIQTLNSALKESKKLGFAYKLKEKDGEGKREYQTLSTNYSVLRREQMRQSFYKRKKEMIRKLF